MDSSLSSSPFNAFNSSEARLNFFFFGFKGEVVSVNVLRQKVKIVVEVDDEREIKEYAIDELKFKPKKKKFNLASEELKALKGLEDKEESKLD